ncbi:15778_t:CDS:1, partial [Dentiscutata erythropus]
FKKMSFINIGFVIPEGEMEIECIYVEEKLEVCCCTRRENG